MILCSAIFGAVAGTYNGGIQILYVAAKIPLLMVITSIFTLPFMIIFGLILDKKMGARFLFNAINFALTQTSIILLGITPILWLFIQTDDYRLSILMMSLLFIIAGGAAIIKTGKIFKEEIKLTATKTIFITVFWAIIYTFVAGQIWWLMRPWIGYSYQERDLPFIRSLKEDEISNVYESIQLTSSTWYERKTRYK